MHAASRADAVWEWIAFVLGRLAEVPVLLRIDLQE